MANLSFDFTDNNKTVTAAVGDTILITLPENATTGFQWVLATLTDTVAFQSRSASPASPTPMGSGGSQVTFRFGATAAGHGQITMALSRGVAADPAAFKYTLNLDIS